MFWHDEQVVELLKGDVGPPKATSSSTRVFLHPNVPSHHQIIQHHQALTLQV
jgi:hypothetical protein